MSDNRKESDDIVYFNAFLNNSTNREQVINFSEVRAQNIINKANDYYMSVVRFDIPNLINPIFNFINNTGSITIREAGVDKQEFLVYLNYGNTLPNIVPAQQGIYYFQQLLDMINNALALAHAAPPVSTGNIPRMLLRSDGRFEMVIDQTYSSQIYFNNDLYYLFIGMEAIFNGYDAPNGTNYEILNKDNGNNTGTYNLPLVGTFNLNVQENNSQYLWPDFKSIVITSSILPVTNELIGVNGAGINTEVAAITDFIPVRDTTAGIDRNDFVYRAQYDFRFIDLNGRNPIRKIDFQVFYVTTLGQLVPLTIGPGQTATIKLQFVKKSLVNNEYTDMTTHGALAMPKRLT